MTAIKKLKDGSGNQFYPQTHTKAVVAALLWEQMFKKKL